MGWNGRGGEVDSGFEFKFSDLKKERGSVGITLIRSHINKQYIHKEKQRDCPLLGANKHTHISNIYVYIQYIIFLFETIASKA